MRRSTLLTCALLMIATSGCKQITEQVQKIKDKIAAARQRNKPAQPAPATPQPAAPAPQDVAAIICAVSRVHWCLARMRS